MIAINHCHGTITMTNGRVFVADFNGQTRNAQLYRELNNNTYSVYGYNLGTHILIEIFLRESDARKWAADWINK